jgi:hypothetical protein
MEVRDVPEKEHQQIVRQRLESIDKNIGHILKWLAIIVFGIFMAIGKYFLH